MKSVPLAALGLLLSAAQAQVVQWDIEKRHDAPQLRRRADPTVNSPVKNEQADGGYFATVSIGNPGQKLTLQIDTGSSDVWVPYSNAPICTETSSSNPGCTFGSFDPDKSKSFDVIGNNLFSIQYFDNSFSKGDYFQDKFEIAGATVKNLTIGLGESTSIPHGLIGLGYAANEASIESADAEYPNLPVAMQEAGLINSVAYSLWLNDLHSSTGSILFGGIDTKKFVGELTRVGIIKDARSDNFTDFAVSMTSLEATSSTGDDALTSSKLPIEVVLDSGTTLSYLPQDLANQFWDEIGASYETEFELAVLPCSFANNPGHFSFGFAGSEGPRINVTMSEVVVDITGGQPPTFPSGAHKGEDVCASGFQNQSSSPYLLGDTFLRSAYVVYDLVNNEIGLAATDFNSTDSNVVAFASKGAAIPSATAAPTQANGAEQSTPTQTDLSAADGFQSETDSGAGLLTSTAFGAVITALAMVSMLWS